MNEIVDIKTGKAISEPPKKPRQKTGQDAKRWRKMYELLESGIMTLVSTGNTLSRDDIKNLSGTLDELIDIDYHEQKKIATRKRREKPKS